MLTTVVLLLTAIGCYRIANDSGPNLPKGTADNNQFGSKHYIICSHDMVTCYVDDSEIVDVQKMKSKSDVVQSSDMVNCYVDDTEILSVHKTGTKSSRK
jgi:hypothetical protein